MQHSEKFLELVNETKTHIQELTVDQVAEKKERGEKFYLVDTREESEWASGHIQDAIHLGKGIIERDIEMKIPDPQAEIILYCGGGYRSALVAENLQKMGYQSVYSMDGGWREWTAKKLPQA